MKRIKNRNSSYAEKLHHQKFRFRQRFSSPGPVGTIPASSCSRTSCICRLTRQGRQRSTRLSRGSRGRCAPPQQRLGRRQATVHWDHGWHRGSWHRGWCSRGWCSRGWCSWRGCCSWRRWCQGTHPRHQSPRLQALRRLRLRQWPQRGYALWQLHGLTRTMLGWMHGHRMHRMGGQRVKTDPRRAREHCDTTSACVFCISLNYPKLKGAAVQGANFMDSWVKNLAYMHDLISAQLCLRRGSLQSLSLVCCYDLKRPKKSQD